MKLHFPITSHGCCCVFSPPLVSGLTYITTGCTPIGVWHLTCYVSIKLKVHPKVTKYILVAESDSVDSVSKRIHSLDLLMEMFCRETVFHVTQLESKWVCWLCCSQGENMVQVKHTNKKHEWNMNAIFLNVVSVFLHRGFCSCITSGLLSVSCGCDRCLKAAGAGRGEQSYCWRDFSLFLFHLVEDKES